VLCFFSSWEDEVQMRRLGAMNGMNHECVAINRKLRDLSSRYRDNASISKTVIMDHPHLI